MTDITALRALNERLQTSTEPGRDLDAALGNALIPRSNGAAYHWKRAPALTSSIDTAHALVVRVLPHEWPAILRAAIDDVVHLWMVEAAECPDQVAEQRHDLLPLFMMKRTVAVILDRAGAVS